MDEHSVRERAEAHGQAVVAGDLRRAADDLTETAKQGAGAVMAELPRSLDSAEIVSVEQTEGEAVATIEYSGEGRTTTVASRWADRGGQPMIVELEIVGSG